MLLSKRGFTVIEILFSALIAAVIISATMLVYVTGEKSLSLGGMKLDRLGEARRTLDGIVRDVRQAVVWDLASAGNNPTPVHVKFRKVEGWDIASDVYQLSANYTEYFYDSTTNTIVKRLLDASNNTLQTWQYNQISQLPFFTKDGSGGTVALNAGDLLTSRVLIVTIQSQDTFRGTMLVNATVSNEVKIRNE